VYLCHCCHGPRRGQFGHDCEIHVGFPGMRGKTSADTLPCWISSRNSMLPPGKYLPGGAPTTRAGFLVVHPGSWIIEALVYFSTKMAGVNTSSSLRSKFCKRRLAAEGRVPTIRKAHAWHGLPIRHQSSPARVALNTRRQPSRAITSKKYLPAAQYLSGGHKTIPLYTYLVRALTSIITNTSVVIAT
jgi:hypothetical protein